MLSGTDRQVNMFFSYLNIINPNIQFTNNSINFLDLTTGRYATTTHKMFDHPHNQRVTSFNFFIHIVITTQLSQVDFNNELNIIRYIALNTDIIKKIKKNINPKHNKESSHLHNSRVHYHCSIHFKK